MLNILVLNDSAGTEWQHGALALPLGNALVVELAVNCLDCLPVPLGSDGLGLCAWDEDVTFLGYCPDKRLDLLLG